MYIHAYQSYVWNAIVSERIRTCGNDKPVVGDLVFDTSKDEADMDVDPDEGVVEDDDVEEFGRYLFYIYPGRPTAELCLNMSGSSKSRKPYRAPRVRSLTEENLHKYTIFDVIMPLPGTDVAYPGGKLGEKYREFLRMDGLDPDNFVRKQR